MILVSKLAMTSHYCELAVEDNTCVIEQIENRLGTCVLLAYIFVQNLLIGSY